MKLFKKHPAYKTWTDESIALFAQFGVYEDAQGKLRLKAKKEHEAVRLRLIYLQTCLPSSLNSFALETGLVGKPIHPRRPVVRDALAVGFPACLLYLRNAVPPTVSLPLSDPIPDSNFRTQVCPRTLTSFSRHLPFLFEIFLLLSIVPFPRVEYDSNRVLT